MSQSLGAPAENRTPDTLIKSQVLYQLSYRGKLHKLYFEFSIGFEEAKKYRQANGQILRRNQWQDLTCQVYI